MTNSAYEIHDISEKRYSGFLGLKPFTDANKQESFLYQLKLYGQIEFLVVSINMGVQYENNIKFGSIDESAMSNVTQLVTLQTMDRTSFKVLGKDHKIIRTGQSDLLLRTYGTITS